jgi:hypothetical protein
MRQRVVRRPQRRFARGARRQTIAAEGRLSPAGGMMSPSFAVTTTSAMPAILRASSAPETFITLPGWGNA